MKSNSYDTLKKLLLQVKEFTTEDNNLNLPKIQKDSFNATDELIQLLLQNETIKKLFFSEQDKVLVYNRDKFLDFISKKNFLASNYTNFSNKIGLAVGKRFLKQNAEVVLNFPFKDCILEGGQTKDNKKQNELFFNETLAADEIDKLLSPKVLTNAKKYTKDGVSDEVEFTRDENGLIKDNLIIKGNNLLALHTLKSNFAGKVKLIYIDPPYNTGNDSFNYNDNFNHSTWLTFMKNRLEIARGLLSDDGVVFIQCDDNEQAYLKVLMDEIFNYRNLNSIISVKVASESGVKVNANKPVRVKEYILTYSKADSYIYKKQYTKNIKFDNNYKFFVKNRYDQPNKWNILNIKDAFNNLEEGKKSNEENLYKFQIKYKDKVFSVRDISSKAKKRFGNQPNQFFVIEKDLKTTILWKKGEVVFFENKVNIIDRVECATKYLSDIWTDISWDGIANEGSVTFKKGKKPEKLLQRIIEMSTKKGDIVLDYHLGSGTTCAVAHKMGRQYIGIEQMDYIEDAVKRIQKVIKGEQGGISKSIEWQGGGKFVYFELKQNTAELIEKITNAKNNDELLAIKNSIKDYTFVDYRINLEFLKNNSDNEFTDFANLPFDEQQKILISIFDKNQMYVNYSEKDDSLFNVSNKDKALSQDFYQNTKTDN